MDPRPFTLRELCRMGAVQSEVISGFAEMIAGAFGGGEKSDVLPYNEDMLQSFGKIGP